ncbi:Hypothetical predicted protein [Podarcis lilfordi]|uniref:Uncharacterized protein n=1 Tax=Podarcis lilfordi TaxID=74358 RepID=A0AA35PFF0_9SAUR|nr:Hypothetical predicted protein [Podarcis lilfordi]
MELGFSLSRFQLSLWQPMKVKEPSRMAQHKLWVQARVFLLRAFLLTVLVLFVEFSQWDNCLQPDPNLTPSSLAMLPWSGCSRLIGLIGLIGRKPMEVEVLGKLQCRAKFLKIPFSDTFHL